MDKFEWRLEEDWMPTTYQIGVETLMVLLEPHLAAMR